MIKKNIKFPLEMKNGEKVRTLEELKANYDIESILNYYFSGKLKVWLEQRFYGVELEQLEGLSEMVEHDIPQMLCSIFEQDFPDTSKSVSESFLVKRKKIETVRQFTDDLTILENIDFVATSQEELEGILAMGNNISKIFLLGEQFEINEKTEKVEYIGINQPIVKLNADEKFDAKKHQIFFKNVILTADSEIKINGDQDIARINTLDESVKEYQGFEKLKQVVDIKKLGEELNYNSLELFVEKVFIGEKIILFADYNPEEILVVEQDKCKVHKKFRTQNKGINAVCKSKTGELLYYYHGDWGQDFSNLIRLDNAKFEEKVVFKNFYAKPNFYEPNILEFFEDTVYTYQLRSTYESKSRTFLYFRSYDINTGKEVEQGRYELPYYYQYGTGIKHYFYRGNLYLYLPNEQILITKEGKHLKLDSDIRDFIILYDKIIAVPKERRGFWEVLNENEEGDLLVLDLNTGEKVKKHKAHKNNIELIKQFGDILVTLTGNGEIKIWDSSDLSLLSKIQLPQEYDYIHKYDIDITNEGMAVLSGGKVFIYE